MVASLRLAEDVPLPKTTDLQAEPVIESLKADIIVGRLKPNEHLVEKEVCLRLSVSRHVVRAALLRLERMGLVIERIHIEYCSEMGSGDFVKVGALNDAFHRCIWSTCPNKVLAEMIEYM